MNKPQSRHCKLPGPAKGRPEDRLHEVIQSHLPSSLDCFVAVASRNDGAKIAPLALSRLLQLASPMLPVGAYAYSQGLEAAIEAGAVRDAASAASWIGDALHLYLGRFELPVLWRMHRTWMDSEGDPAWWNGFLCAGRDTAEGRAETLQMGYSLLRLVEALDGFAPAMVERLRAIADPTFPLVYAFAAAQWGIHAEAALQAFAWSWLENQVAVAMKAVPIGQVAGQKILLALSSALPQIVAVAGSLDDDDISNFAPGLSLAGCRHETQYSRLFRS